MYLNAMIFGQPSWIEVVIIVSTSIFGGHGLIALWLKTRKDVISALIQSNTANSLELGQLKGKIESLERQLTEVRVEKHDWRNRAHRLHVYWQGECAYSTELMTLLQKHGIPVPRRPETTINENLNEI